MVAQFKKQVNTSTRIPKYNRPHVIIPTEDLAWARLQKLNVRNLFDDCWTSDPYGSRWMPLRTPMNARAFRGAKKVLEESGLFKFRIVIEVIEGIRMYVHYIWNMHGARNNFFWRDEESEVIEDSNTQEVPPQNMGVQNDVELKQIHTEGYITLDDLGIKDDDIDIEMPSEYQINVESEPEIKIEQEPHKRSGTLQKLLINFSKKVMRSKDSSTPQHHPAEQVVVVVEDKKQEEEKTQNGASLTDSELEDAYWEMRDTESEPIMPVKEALLNSPKLEHVHALQNLARRKGWELPQFAPVPKIDRSFLTKKVKTQKVEYIGEEYFNQHLD